MPPPPTRYPGDARYVRESDLVTPTVKEAGAGAWFEYHCTQSHDFVDAAAWYRSHLPVVILERESFEDETGSRHGYTVRFPDGHVHQVFDDELYDAPEHFHERPQALVGGGFAPPPLAQIRAHDPGLADFLAAQRAYVAGEARD